MTTIELKTKLQGVIRGVPCKLQPYHCRLQVKDNVIFEVGQPFTNGTIGWLPGCRLQGLINSGVWDELYIDFGQDWKVKGMKEALKEALTHVEFKLKERS